MTDDISLTAEKMESLVQQWEAEADQRTVFLKCYRLMTLNMGCSLQLGEFNDNPWVSRWLEHFANYYFFALDAFERNDPQTPGAWSIAFKAAQEARCSVIQNLLLGINAHINYDLVLTVVDMLDHEWADLAPEMRQSRQADFIKVNQVIGQTIDTVQDEILERHDPRLKILDTMLGPLDEWLISQLIASWRDEVWKEAIGLMETPDEQERGILRRELENKVMRLAETILFDSD